MNTPGNQSDPKRFHVVGMRHWCWRGGNHWQKALDTDLSHDANELRVIHLNGLPPYINELITMKNATDSLCDWPCQSIQRCASRASDLLCG